MIKPLAKRLLVKRSIPPTQKGSLLLPSQEIKNEGIVIAIGCEVMEIDEGEIVLWMPYAGQSVKSGDEELIILSESDILGIRYE